MVQSGVHSDQDHQDQRSGGGRGPTGCLGVRSPGRVIVRPGKLISIV